MSDNIFNKPKVTTTKVKPKSQTDFLRIKPNSIEQDELFDLIKKFEQLGSESKKITTSVNYIKGNLKDIAVGEYLTKYEEDDKNPGSIIIEAINDDGDVGQYLFVPQDRYIGVNSEKQANELEDKYGEGLIERTITYSFDPEMLDKYTDVISELVANCDDIEVEDKAKLFVASESYKVVSGTINELNSLELGTIKEAYEGLKPVVSIKSAEVIKS
jgi:hypothetical protein